ncbi:MAG: hypothetical protein K9M03_02145 [Kiritimatiellales bacterium]|nr:hypothetical protein [Kiritimatiellales bacterium]
MPTFEITMDGHKFRTCRSDVAESHVRVPEVFGFFSDEADRISSEVRSSFIVGEFARFLEKEAVAITRGKKVARTSIEGLFVEISASPFSG